MVLHVNEFPQDLLVYVDKGQIQQTLLNLMLNALVAMPNGGKLIIEVGRTEEGKAQVLVEDTGTGIPEELKGRIFDSFLTGTTEGTGLGLSISKRILRAHDGNLDLLKSGPEGTVFKITLPLASQET